MRLIDADALFEYWKNKLVPDHSYITDMEILESIKSAPTISEVKEVRLKDLTEEEKRELVRLLTKYPISGHIVPDYLRGREYKEN